MGALRERVPQLRGAQWCAPRAHCPGLVRRRRGASCVEPGHDQWQCPSSSFVDDIRLSLRQMRFATVWFVHQPEHQRVLVALPARLRWRYLSLSTRASSRRSFRFVHQLGHTGSVALPERVFRRQRSLLASDSFVARSNSFNQRERTESAAYASELSGGDSCCSSSQIRFGAVLLIYMNGGSGHCCSRLETFGSGICLLSRRSVHSAVSLHSSSRRIKSMLLMARLSAMASTLALRRIRLPRAIH